MSSSLTPEPVKQQVGLTDDDIRDIRTRADDDVFYFAVVICGHRDLVFEDHAPAMYAAAGDAAKLLAILISPTLDSYTIRKVREECARLGVDLRAEDAEGRLSEALRVVDERVYRKSGKSSSITHGVRTWKLSKDPNLTSCLITNTDDKAKDFCKQIRATILSDIYAAVYPDRIPADPKSMLTESRITVAGRTVPDMEPCLMAFGVKSSPTGYHFDEFHLDDLVGRENKSVAELVVVREFLANLSGLYKPGIRYRVRRVHVGTRWDEDDDSAYVRNYPKCFTITVPIWVRDSPADDLRVPGVPTTQWFPLEKILAEQEEVLSNPDEGAISWRCNYELDPTLAGGRIFPAEMVDAAKWTSHRDPRPVSQGGTDGREWVSHVLTNDKPAQLLGADGKRVFNDKLEPVYSQYVQKIDPDTNLPRYNKTRPIYRVRAFDPATLYKVMAFDQSFSEDGDEWAGAVVGMDQYAHRNVLEIRVGHNLEAMLDAAEMMRQTWNPRRAGMEKIAAQHAIELVMKLGTKYFRLRPLIEPIPHNNLAKEYRIRNYVAEIMKMHRLWLHPRDIETAAEMKKYKPGKTAKDNILDALAMCEVLIQKSLAPKDGEEDYKKKFARINNATKARRDQQTGVSLW